MSNKMFWALLGGCVLSVIGVMATITGFVPVFLVPFVVAVIGLYIVYMAR